MYKRGQGAKQAARQVGPRANLERRVEPFGAVRHHHVALLQDLYNGRQSEVSLRGTVACSGSHARQREVVLAPLAVILVHIQRPVRKQHLVALVHVCLVHLGLKAVPAERRVKDSPQGE